MASRNRKMTSRSLFGNVATVPPSQANGDFKYNIRETGGHNMIFRIRKLAHSIAPHVLQFSVISTELLI